ncbi:MAG: hypothetical protein KBA03_03645 [Anaerolineaceae bacterium]|nr:hypothetical protein [Anaerolineaceae bacterium]
MANKPPVVTKYVNVPAGPAYDSELPDGVFRTYVQLKGMAWGKDVLEEVTIKQLMEVTGKARSTIYGHLELLRDRGWLLFNSAHKFWLTVSFCGGVGNNGEEENQNGCGKPVDKSVDKPVDKLSRNLDLLNKEEVKELKDFNNINLPPPNIEEPTSETVQKSGQVSRFLDGRKESTREEPEEWADVIPDDVAAKLRDINLYDAVLPKLAVFLRERKLTIAQLNVMIKQVAAEGGKGGMLMYRIKNGLIPKTEEQNLDKFRAAYALQEAQNGG